MVGKIKMTSSKNIVFRFCKSYSISYKKDLFCCVGSSVNLYDTKTGEYKASFNDMTQPNFSKFTSDNRLIVKTTRGYYYIYDLASKKLIKKLRPPKRVLGSTTDFTITPDNRFILDFAEIFPNSQLLVMEIETGEYTLYDLGGAKSCNIFHDKSTSEYHIESTKTSEAGNACYAELYTFSYPFEQLALKLELVFDKEFSQVDYHSGKLAIAGYEGKITIYDTNSSTEEQYNYDNGGVLYGLKWSKNGRLLVLTESEKIQILDTKTKKCVISYDVDYGCFADFYDNDTKLLIGTWQKGYCVDIGSVLPG